ncbi:hypothetical protein GCM10010166_60000 [Couchioplanes caeruleus subsp. azureus]|nr:hypothetical protein GCM10010166_60000 [Couchioplanes caeruleus subsp. azureus]
MRAIRASAVQQAMGPALAGLYLIGTLGAPHRPAMLAVVGVMLAVTGIGWSVAARLAGSRLRIPAQLTGVAVTLAGSATLTLLDGGVARPLGALVPFSLVLLAIVLPPRIFAVVAAAGVAAYAGIALVGDPAPPGYAVVHALGFGAAAYLCLRHSRALASLRRRLTDLSRVDPLTGCLNRRGFDERLHQELAESARSGHPLTLVLVDLDRFKEINDRYGHRVGDELLTWAGRTLRDELGDGGAVGRLGGDEFAVLLAGTAPAEAAPLVNRLRAALAAAAPGSLGQASAPAEAATAGELRDLADRLLYDDKAARDRSIPGPETIAAACGQVEEHTPATVSRRERRRHSIADAGWISVAKGLTGLTYAGILATAHPDRGWIALVSAAGGLLGLAVLAAADWLSRSALARPTMLAATAALFGFSAVVTVADGGVTAPTGVALLVAMPLLALGTRLRAVLPALAAAALLYLGMAAVVGAPDGWYVAIHLAQAITLSLICALQGRTAARQRALVTRLSRVDSLTGCLNRRGFAERFATDLGNARRTDRPATLLVLDLDGFKQLNDTRGHAAGDELLTWVAATIAATLRPHDAVGRLGGDEFVAFVGDCGEADAAAVAERLRHALGERTSVSIGAATLDRDGDDFDSLYAHADAALYSEKARRAAPGRGPVQDPGIGHDRMPAGRLA